MHLDFEEVQKIKNQIQRVSHSVIFNPDGSFTCRRRYEGPASLQEFATDLKRMMIAARRGKIDVLQETVEGAGPSAFFVVVRFKPLR